MDRSLLSSLFHVSSFRFSLVLPALLLSIACADPPEVGGGNGDGDGDQSTGGEGTGGDSSTIDVGNMGGDGNSSGGGTISADCGNGDFEEGEVCDDGNNEDGDGCSADCLTVDPNFLCIDAGDPCLRVATCGNGKIEGSEVCDDNNTEGGDGCSGTCSAITDGYACIKPGETCVLLPACGNGQRERGEQCDDGQSTPASGDGCDENCQQEEGFFCPPGQPCVPVACGDGNRTPGEQCDDGPGTVGAPGTPVDGDGCSASCQIEENWRCSATGCSPVCGNGSIDGSEQCDDGNLSSGDGCSSACREEPFYDCTDEPSDCTSTVVCGDGLVGPGEVCDYNASGQQACFSEGASACKGYDTELVDPPVCGNSVIEYQEECDGDGGGVGAGGCIDCVITDGFSCPAANYCFRLPACGDGLLQAGEQCDPGAMSAVGCIDCLIDDDYYCSGEPSDCVASICGDGLLAPDEQCDDGPSAELLSGDGCSETCTVETGWVCPPGIACLPVCGDGVLQGAEECEESGTACTNCKLNPGFDCDTDGLNCFATECGNNSLEAGEGCDDGNTVAGDGCGPTCQLEPTITRVESPTGVFTPVVNVTCGDGLITGDEECDDGNISSFDGCDEDCNEEAGWTCVDLLDYPAAIDFRITYRDFIQRLKPGGHPHMKEQGIQPPNSGLDRDIPGVACTSGNGSACGKLDQDGKPVYNQLPGGNNLTTNNPTIDPSSDGLSSAQHAQYFSLWYRDTNDSGYVGLNGAVDICPNAPLGNDCTGTAINDTLRLNRVGTTTAYEFASASNDFYPLGHSGLTNPTRPERGFGYTMDTGATDFDTATYSGSNRNFHFTSELRYFFQYQGGETLTFYGDDDVWVFINGRLAVDIGGIHGQEWGRVVLGDDGSPSGTDSNCSQHGGGTLSALGGCYTTAEQADSIDARFGLDKGGVYEIVVLQAERHPTGSNYRLTLDGFIAPRSSCSTFCGDGVRAGSELCDSGPDMPSSGYGVCRNDCTFEFCGDNVETSPEECDDGTNADTYGTGCAPGCVTPGNCGDGIVQSAFEVCDDGTNDGSYGGCMPGCQELGPYCGDDVVTLPETCDTPGEFTNYATVEGACRFDCQAAGFCGDDIRNGNELCDGSANCNADCEFDPFCGDGLKTADEECDYGTFAFVGSPEDAPYGSCTDQCLLGPSCGDDVLHDEDGEECDEGSGNVNGVYNECTLECVLGPRCGDGIHQSIFGESCDNGFNDDDYAYEGAVDPCGPDCSPVAFCGDAVVQSSYELCDDGTANDDGAYDGCTESCEWGPYCGDGQINGSEQCDDGIDNVAYSSTGAGCSYECTTNVPYCGDGVRNGPEQCDLGTAQNTGAYGGCESDCSRAPRCGDGIVQTESGEQCDAGPAGSATCTQACRLRVVVK